MRRLLLYICIILSPCICFAEDIYISQTSQGADSGADCVNSHSTVWFNTLGNWANPKQSGKIGPGDTVHLCGTLTTQVTIQASGTSGSPITILFEKGAKFSASTWTDGTAIITTVGKNYITIDGGTNGTIEATDNGTPSQFGGTKTYLNNIYGISINSGNSITIKNLTVRNLYDRLAGCTDCKQKSNIIIIFGTLNDFIVDGNNLSSASRQINMLALYNSSNIHIKNNIMTNSEVEINGGPTNNSTIDGIYIYGNHITGGTGWTGLNDTNTCLNYQSLGCSANCVTNYWKHIDGIHLFTVYNSDTSIMSNVKIYSNYMQDFGTTGTGHIYLEYSGMSNALIYNNVLVTTGTNFAANGIITVKAADNVKIYNNTIVGSGTTLNNAIYLNTLSGHSPQNIEIKNNIISSVRSFMAWQPGSTWTADYNDLYNGSARYPFQEYNTPYLMSWWTGQGYDAHGTSENPQLDVNYKLTLSSPSKIKSGGVNLSTIFTTDKYGVVRPGVAGWSLGAYQDNWPNPPNLQIQ